MEYISTRDGSVRVSAAQAIAQGISRESGLFVPETLPALRGDEWELLLHKDYVGRARQILGGFLTGFTPGELEDCVAAAYGPGSGFAPGPVAPIAALDSDTYMLELWHGPTCAFKDMALQLLPHLLTTSMEKTAGGKEAVILVATSGDTGKAALEGFRDVKGTRILSFYPWGGVSRIQHMQMATQQGGNVAVCGVEGNFDDTQTAVKSIFTDPGMNRLLAERNMMFSSANSINWGRLVPQIVYYASAYLDLVSEGRLAMGEPLNVCVPTGNFGNILAAYYAKRMGVPLGKLICASNINNVLTDFIRTGVYDRRREFHLTSSPSMDILISSNLERLLHALYEQDGGAVCGLMDSLSSQGFYSVTSAAKEKLRKEFWGGYCTEEDTAATIRATYGEKGYLCDTHTAVALKVCGDYRKETGDRAKTLVASTANPYKFAGSILTALTGKASEQDEFAQAAELSRLTKTEIPEAIRELERREDRFGGKRCTREEMPGVVKEMLGMA